MLAACAMHNMSCCRQQRCPHVAPTYDQCQTRGTLTTQLHVTSQRGECVGTATHMIAHVIASLLPPYELPATEGPRNLVAIFKWERQRSARDRTEAMREVPGNVSRGEQSRMVSTVMFGATHDLSSRWFWSIFGWIWLQKNFNLNEHSTGNSPHMVSLGTARSVPL